jgi:hypothetical protein
MPAVFDVDVVVMGKKRAGKGRCTWRPASGLRPTSCMASTCQGGGERLSRVRRVVERAFELDSTRSGSAESAAEAGSILWMSTAE